jgi:iron(III) transport system ATP-binding protein
MRCEIRRLHDAYKYTTIYVTHDQTEAMTTADTIVVMNRGRVEQVGSPEDIYLRPCSEFVARFIGGTNIFRGRKIADNLIDCGGLVLRCAAGEPAAAGTTAVSVRLHEIAIEPVGDGAIGGDWQPNEAAGRVVRQAYLGSYRDYLISLADGKEVRLTAPLGVDVPVGGTVRLRFPPEHCRALAR